MHTAAQDLTRRAFLGGSAAGLGSLALGALLRPAALAADPAERWRGVVNPPHHSPRVKRVIYLYQAGGPSHLELFDPKPRLRELHGQPMPESFTAGQQIAQLQGKALKCLGGLYDFQRFGRSGLELCSLFPELGSVADDLCVIRSMYTEQINHDPAHTFMNTGSIIAGRPSMGSWLLYGLGSETEELPGYIVLMSSGKGGQMQPIAARQWHSGFLPSRFQGVKFQSQGDPVHYISNPAGVGVADQQDLIDVVNGLNRRQHDALRDPEILTRINQYEMAFRMQASVPTLTDLSNEPARMLEQYGARPGDGSFASNCLLARRLAERGVRFIQLYHRDWDHHSQLREELPLKAKETDQASAALIKDLKQRGLLDDTLVVWTGEFGRTPMAQATKGTMGRDHHNKAMSMWLAGAGIRRGMVYGATDELGYAAVENVCTVHDLHATMLHQLGIRHDAFSVKFQGLDAKLTGVEGANVLTGILG